MSLGGGGYGGEGLPYPSKVLQLWGGELEQTKVPTPAAPTVVRDDGSGPREYSIVAVSPQGDRTPPSPAVKASRLATLQWDSIAGADAYIILRDGKQLTEPLRIEGRQKQWSDGGSP
jgi:hypothetical protein